jgi:hypothetical protein
MVILLISAFQGARISGMNHWHLMLILNFKSEVILKIFCSVGDLTQNLTHAKQVPPTELYLSPNLVFLFAISRNPMKK